MDDSWRENDEEVPDGGRRVVSVAAKPKEPITPDGIFTRALEVLDLALTHIRTGLLKGQLTDVNVRGIAAVMKAACELKDRDVDPSKLTDQQLDALIEKAAQERRKR